MIALSRFTKSNLSVTTDIFQQGLHPELQSCIGEHKRKLNFFNWPFKILKVREFQKVSWNCLHSMFERMFLRNYRLNIDFFEIVLNWNLGTFSVEWGWKIKFCDPRLEISTARNIQKRHFRLIFFVSQSQNSPWSQALIFLTRCESETSDLNRKTRNLIKFFDRSINILIARKFHELFRNCFNSLFKGKILHSYSLNFFFKKVFTLMA